MELDQKFIPISDLFGNDRLMKAKGKALDERATLIEYFCRGVAHSPARIGIRVSHYNLSDLYALKSSFEDRLRRPCGDCLGHGATGSCLHSRTTAQKYFWWVTRTEEV